MARDLKRKDAQFNPDLVLRALSDSLAGKKLLMTDEEVTATLDRAETLVFEVANRRLSSSLKGIYPALQESLAELESLFERDGSLTGVPSGFRAARFLRGLLFIRVKPPPT